MARRRFGIFNWPEHGNRFVVLGDDAMTSEAQSRVRVNHVGVTIAWSAVVAVVTWGLQMATPIWKWTVAPFLIAEVQAGMASDLNAQIQAAVEKQVAPLERKVNSSNQGLAVIIESNIRQLEIDIGNLGYIRDYQRQQWTKERSDEYIAKTQQLQAQRAALAAIRGSQ